MKMKIFVSRLDIYNRVVGFVIIDSTKGMAERTYIMIKPDGVQRGLVGAIIARF
jgi:hypothetical protein